MSNAPTDENVVKVLLQEGEYVETLWAERVGPDLYRLDNCPWYAYGVSWKDIVEAHPDADGMLVMSRVAEKSGHRTIRVIFKEKVTEWPKGRSILDGALALGATCENSNDRYMAIDIPPGVDLMSICRHFSEHEVEWEHADPTYESLYPEVR
jgi:hypothetical protein